MMKKRTKKWKMMNKRKNDETWWTRETKTMKNDGKKRKQNEKWWTREKKPWKPLKNMEKTVKSDEKIAGTQTRKHDET